MAADLAALRQQARADVVDLREQGIERPTFDRGIVLERREQLSLPLQLLQNIGLEIGARGNVGNLEQS